MRGLLILLLLAIPGFGAWGNGYTYRSSITIDHTKVPNTDQANFPVLIAGTYTDLKHTTHSGFVTDLNGYDIAFYSDAAGTTALYWEIESYNHETGAIVAWVKVPTVATASDTVIYMFFGNASVSTFQSTVATVWSNGFVAVHHLPDGTTALSALDSTSNDNDGTLNLMYEVAGKIDGGATTDGGDIALPGTNFPSGAASRSMSVWLYKAALGSEQVAYSYGNSGTGLLFGITISAANNVTFAGYAADVDSGVSLSATTWTHVAVTFDGTTIRTYVNGSAGATGTPTLNTGTTYWYLGRFGGGLAWSGRLDEARLATSVRSADWISTEYANQNDPGTFYAVGTKAENSARRRVVITQ